jgi:lysophospholipase L1-like esterase
VSRLRWLLPRLLLAVGSLVVFLGGVELAAVAWDWAAYGVRRVDGQPEGLYINAPGEAPRLRPGARLSGLRYAVSVNQHGFRGAELSPGGPADTLRIWCVGGSTTFDIYAPTDAEAWPAVAEARLRQRLPERSIDVINAGVPGEILEGSTAALQAQGRALGVDYVVVHHGPNDLRQLFIRPMLSDRPPRPWERTAAHNVLIHWLQGQGMVRVPLVEHRLDGASLQELRRRLQRLLEVVARVGARPIFATHAARISADSSGAALQREVGELAFQWSMEPESVRAVLDGYNALVRRLAEEWRAPVADFRGVVPADRRYWGDATHFSAEGSALAGAELARVVEAELGRR